MRSAKLQETKHIQVQASGELSSADRDFQFIKLGGSSFGLEIMIFGEKRSEIRPLVILHSMEFPFPPSTDFCNQMRRIGYQVIFVRRSGFGKSSQLPQAIYHRSHVDAGVTAMTEAAIVTDLLSVLNLTRVVVLALGSANPVAYRLAQIAPSVEVTLLVNPMFNRITWGAFRPAWLGHMLSHVIKSNAGLWFAERSLKHLLRHAPVDLFAQIFKSSDGDLAYLETNEPDFLLASHLMLSVSSAAIYADLGLNLQEDRVLSDTYFVDRKVAAIAGVQSPSLWQKEMSKEAFRLNVPMHLAPAGDLLCPYQCPLFLSHVIGSL